MATHRQNLRIDILPGGDFHHSSHRPQLRSAACGKLWPRPGQPVQLGDHQRVAGAARGEGESQSGPIPVGGGQAVVDVYAVVTDTERPEGVSLRGQILLFR
jgi:hypothetical protein